MILPFDATELSSEQSVLAQFSLELPSELRKAALVRTLDRQTSKYYQTNPTPLRLIRDQTGIDYLVQPSLSGDNDLQAMSIEVTDAATGLVTWEGSYQLVGAELFKLGTTIVGDIATNIDATIISRTDSYQPNPAAYDEYMLGLYHMDRQTYDDEHEAIRRFENAIALDSMWAPPYTGVARASNILSGREQLTPEERAHAVVRANQSMVLDSLLAEAWVVRSWTETENTNYKAAVDALHRAIELDPGLAVAHFWLGIAHLYYVDSEYALETYSEAVRLDPMNQQQLWLLGRMYLMVDRWEEAEAVFERMRNINPGFPGVLGADLLLTAHSGDIETTLQMENEYEPFRPPSTKLFGKLYVLSLAGRPDLIREALDDAPDSVVTASHRVLGYAAMNDYDEAFNHADGLDLASDFLSYIQIQMFSPVKFTQDPRWRVIQEEMGMGLSLLE